MANKKKTIIEYRNYFLPLDFPILLLSGEYWRIYDKPSGKLHFHNCLEIGICHSNSGILSINEKLLPFSAGDITCIPRNIPHATYSNPGTDSHWSYLFLDPQNMLHHLLPEPWRNYDLAISPLNEYRFILSKNEYPEISMLTNQIVNELTEQKPGYHLSIRGLLLSIYIMLYRIQTVNTEKNKDATEYNLSNALHIAPALNYIDDNISQPINVETLATLCGWSLTHFRRIFREIMRVSPLEYINNMRISKACLLLRSTEESILNISESVGFRSVSSFNRLFFREMQITPREYRRQMIEPGQRIEKYAGWLFP
jgi:AraC-like DNA-binding protein